MPDVLTLLRKPVAAAAVALAVIALYWGWRIALVIGGVGIVLRFISAIPSTGKLAIVAMVAFGIHSGTELWQRRHGYGDLIEWLGAPRSPQHMHPGVASYEPLIGHIDRATAPDDAIHVFGDQAQLYWLTRRRPASRFFWLNAAFIRRGNVARSPEVQEFQTAGVATFIAEFKANTPRLVIVSRSPYEANKAAGRLFGLPGIQAEIAAHYERLEDVGSFEVYQRISDDGR